MKIVLWLLLCLALPVAASANSVDFTNSGGTLSGSTAGLSLSGSTFIAINAGTLLTGDLGTITFSTGALTSGSLQMGGTFAAGGAFTITGNGTNGIPNGVIFTGSFTGPVTWNLVTLANGTHNYTLVGALSGTWFTGASAEGATVQLTINTGKGFFNGSTTISSGDTNIAGNGLRIAPTPEPSSMMFMGSGLCCIAYLLRRKRRQTTATESNLQH